MKKLMVLFTLILSVCAFTESTTVEVNQGWNLISNPYRAPVWSYEGLSEYYHSDYIYLYSKTEGKYINYKRGTLMQVGMGYWIYLDGLEDIINYPVTIYKPAVLPPSAPCPPKYTPEITFGWNLIGIPSPYLKEDMNIISVWSYDPIAREYVLHPKEDLFSDEYWGWGFWVFYFE